MVAIHHPVLGQVAQSVEQGTENPRVGGSIPSLPIPFHIPIAQNLHASPERSWQA